MMVTIQESELAPIVAQMIGQPDIDSLTWELSPLKVDSGGFAGVLGLERLVGTAQVQGQTRPWSVVVKRIRKPDSTQDPWGTAHNPSALNYWQWEILAYQYGRYQGDSANASHSLSRCHYPK